MKTKKATKMQSFDDKNHKMVLSEDGSYTAYSKEYDEHYHSTKDGALHESLVKHVIPAFKIKQYQEEINILDICFGLGFNALATLYFVKSNNITNKINIYSPELDADLVNSLKNFTYPKEFDGFKHIISELVDKGFYDDESWHVEIFLGDAREYIKRFSHQKFDIVYQDAFSPSVNPVLWTKEYFRDIKKIIKDDGVLTTYSTALKTRVALYENGFNLYINSGDDFRNATVASPSKLDSFKGVDMEHKIRCNPDIKPLVD
jgi:tRNA U34 5-methylaminomethyl-2-thiouridine-forming methyltransferase MnmC